MAVWTLTSIWRSLSLSRLLSSCCSLLPPAVWLRLSLGLSLGFCFSFRGWSSPSALMSVSNRQTPVIGCDRSFFLSFSLSLSLFLSPSLSLFLSPSLSLFLTSTRSVNQLQPPPHSSWTSFSWRTYSFMYLHANVFTVDVLIFFIRFQWVRFPIWMDWWSRSSLGLVTGLDRRLRVDGEFDWSTP